MMMHKTVSPLSVPPAAVIPHPAAPARRAASTPTALSCLRCQLLGRRSLTCAAADRCARLPPALPVGPVLLGVCLAAAAAFLYSIW